MRTNHVERSDRREKPLLDNARLVGREATALAGTAERQIPVSKRRSGIEGPKPAQQRQGRNLRGIQPLRRLNELTPSTPRAKSARLLKAAAAQTLAFYLLLPRTQTLVLERVGGFLARARDHDQD
jgi:hypothetical protein